MAKPPGAGTREAPLSSLPPIAPLPTAAERAADLIRRYIFEGRFAPGMPLPEAGLSAALQVSRNTVRESFRTLIGEHLLIHEPHKGVTVRWLSPDDVQDIYKLRRMFELSALDLLIQGEEKLGKDQLDAIGETVTEADEAAAKADWAETGTANLRFHALLVELHRSERINDTFRRLMTEMRLGFLAHDDPAAFHGRFLARNRALYERMGVGELAEARRELARYLDEAEDDVIRAVAS